MKAIGLLFLAVTSLSAQHHEHAASAPDSANMAEAADEAMPDVADAAASVVCRAV